MEKPRKSQIAKISLIALLFLIIPLLSTSMRPPYLYFLLNLLIIALGAESGLLSFLTPSNDEKLRGATLAPKPLVLIPSLPSSSSSSSGAAPVKEADHNHHDAVTVTKTVNIESSSNMGTDEKKVIKVMENSISEKIVSTVTTVVKARNIVKKCPSMPSLFFIGAGEGDIANEEDQEEEEEMEGTLSGQELFTKAETFIGNFYKQLKIQREESWKRIHGFYQKTF